MDVERHETCGGKEKKKRKDPKIKIFSLEVSNRAGKVEMTEGELYEGEMLDEKNQ